MSKLLLLIAGMATCGGMVAQSDTSILLAPETTFGYSISNEYKINAGIASRQQLRDKDGITGVVEGYEYVHTDFSIDLSKDTGLNNKFQLGYLIRLQEREPVHRLRQRFTIVQNYNSFRLSHRFSAEQTFVKNRDTDVRFRYRIAPEIPLSGLTVDPQEFYLKMSGEFLAAFQSEQLNDLEIRLLSQIGFEFRNGIQLEIGPVYRYDNFTKSQKGRHRIFLTISNYIQL